MNQEKDMLSTLVSMNIRPTAYIMSKNINLLDEQEKGNAQDIIQDPNQERLKQIALKNAASEKKRRLFDIEPAAYDQTYTKTVLTKDIFEKEEDPDVGKKKEKDRKEAGSRMKMSEAKGNRCRNL